MKQVKILEQGNCYKLEKSVNKWIQDNPNLEIFSSYISIGSMGAFPSYVICITYSDKLEKLENKKEGNQ